MANRASSSIQPSGFWLAQVVSIDTEKHISVKIPKLGGESVYEEVRFTGFTPAVGDYLWVSFIEGTPGSIIAFVGANDTENDPAAADITAVLAGTNLNGGGTTGSVTLNLDDDITIDSLQFDIAANTTIETEGLLAWNEDWGTIDIGLHGNNAVLHVGQQVYYYAKNQTGSQIEKGTVVRFDGALGASGHLKMAPFLANGTYPSEFIMGVTAHDIPNGDDGYVVHFGAIRGIDTDTPNWNPGDVLYVSPTTAGGLTTTAPTAPNNIILVAAVINRHSQNGELFVRPTIAANILKDEGVIYTSLSDNDTLVYNSATGTFENTAFDHGGLTGLGDDDHTQYLLASGTRAATELTISNDLSVGANLGIGTAPTSYRLDVDGTGRFTGTLTASGGIGGLTLDNGGISGSNFNITGVNQMTINDEGEGILFPNVSLYQETGDTDRLRLTGNLLVLDDAGPHITIRDSDTADASGYIAFEDSSSTRLGYIGYGNNDDIHIKNENAGGNIFFNTSNTWCAYFNTSGNFVPYTDSSFDLGASTLRWTTAYVDTLNAGSDNLLSMNGEWNVIRRESTRGAVSFTSKDDSVYIGNGDVAHEINTTYVGITGENTYIASDGNVYIMTDLQEGWGTHHTFTFDNTGTAIFPVDLSVPTLYTNSITPQSGDTIGIGASNKTAVMYKQMWADTITWNSGVNINTGGENSIDVQNTSGHVFQVWDIANSAPFIKCATNARLELGQNGTKGVYVHGAVEASGVVTANEFRASDYGPENDASFTFVSDEDSGMYRAGTNDVRLTTGGTWRIRAYSDGCEVNGNYLGSRAFYTYNSQGNVGNATINIGNGNGSGVILAFNPSGYAPLITCGQGEHLYVRNYLNNAYAILDAVLIDRSSLHSKQSIQTLGDTPLSAGSMGNDLAAFDAMETVRKLRPVSYYWYEVDALPRMPVNEDGTRNERRISALQRLNNIRAKKNLPNFDREDLRHICGRDCDRTMEDPCWRTKNFHNGKVGFIAQEVGEVIPQAAVLSEEREEYESIDTLALVAVLTKAVQDMDDRLKNQANTISEMQTQIEDLQSRLQ